ncbi:hypothetical protein BJY01DRAFT_228106 [Aspergillus pseudoustus]|uniref:Uncharacterized protein n=1 Tax=Aspergillus pseudoustus TaxID=1810923 RepID=A0ABR4IMS1_9EURO
MVDDLYGDALLDALREARSCVIREANKCKAPSNATIDGVVILNSYCDASLLTAAIREAFGDQVEIFGSTTGQDVTYVARLGARAALRLRDLAVSDVEHACKYAGRDEEDELWYELHGEL